MQIQGSGSTMAFQQIHLKSKVEIPQLYLLTFIVKESFLKIFPLLKK